MHVLGTSLLARSILYCEVARAGRLEGYAPWWRERQVKLGE